jgi:hypothetical protein
VILRRWSYKLCTTAHAYNSTVQPTIIHTLLIEYGTARSAIYNCSWIPEDIAFSWDSQLWNLINPPHAPQIHCFGVLSHRPAPYDCETECNFSSKSIFVARFINPLLFASPLPPDKTSNAAVFRQLVRTPSYKASFALISPSRVVPLSNHLPLPSKLHSFLNRCCS